MKIARLMAPALMLFAISPVHAQDAGPDAKLSIWSGNWTYHEQSYETRYSHASTYDGTADCNWSVNHGFMVCDFMNHHPSAGTPVNDLAIFSYDSTSKKYSQVGVFHDNKPFTQQLMTDGNTWTSSAAIPYQGKTIIHRNVYVFESVDKRATTTQISADNGKTWTTITRFTAEKTAP